MMKISPLPASGAQIGNISGSTGQTSSPEKIAAAKAIAAGQQPPAYAPLREERERLPDIKRIKMNVNQTTPSYNPESDTSDLVDPTQATSQVANEPLLEETKPLSPQLAALAKQKRALQVKEREIQEREKALSSQPAGQDLVARLKTDPLSVLQEAGVTYDQLTDAILGKQVDPEISKLKEEIKALKEGVDKSFTDRDAQEEQQVLQEMRRTADQLIQEGDAYEMIRETQSQKAVIDLIYKTYKSTGEVLEVQDALNLVEEELINESLKVARINKVQSRLTPAQPVQEKKYTSGMRTLTSRDSASPSMSSKQRALAAFYGTLKK